MLRKQMLIVDDNTGLREALKAVFEDEYELAFAGNGEEALRSAFRRPPQVVLMDYRMPGLDGMETMEYLRRLAPFSKMVLMSAYDDRETVTNLFRGGAFDFVGKPFELYEIKEVVKNAAAKAGRYIDFSTVKINRKPVISQNELNNIIDDTLKVACL